MGANLRPISGAQFNVLQHAITALRVALRQRRGSTDLRPVQLRVDFHRDIDQIGDKVVISPEAMIRFNALKSVRNNITPHAGRLGGSGESNQPLRPWPFRWPSQDLPVLTAFPVPDPLPVTGRYIDILF